MDGVCGVCMTGNMAVVAACVAVVAVDVAT
jgi:hypothetical protein